MSNPSKNTNPLDYPAYVRGLRPALPESLGQYVDDELEKLQNAFDNAAYAADKNAEARVAAETYARIEGDAAVAGLVTDVESKINDPDTGLAKAHSRITEEASARASADSALASRTSTLEAAVNHADTGLAKAHARITDEAVARANADSALATRATNLESTVGSHTASISTLQSSVDGLKLRYSVTLNSNGHITGFTQNNDGTTGEFVVVADRFKVVSPGQTPRMMFQVDSQGVHYTGKHTITGLTSGTLNADMQMGTGRIIWDNGAYMKVAGVGFGSSNQFIEWFGPKMAISSCTEANAISYLKTNGDAYFGGSLSAGTLRNAEQSTSTSPTASLTMSPFGSNGGPRQVTLSYTLRIQGARSSSGTVSGTFDVGAITLQRSVDGGNTWSTVTTMNVTAESFLMFHNGGQLTGPGSFSASGSEHAAFIMSASQSTTLTDSYSHVGNLTYRATLSGRSGYTITGSAPYADTTAQSISIVSVET